MGGIIFLIGLGVYSSYAADSTACTISENSSYATIYDTPECNTAFDATRISRWMMIVGGAAAITFPVRRFLGR